MSCYWETPFQSVSHGSLCLLLPKLGGDRPSFATKVTMMLPPHRMNTLQPSYHGLEVHNKISLPPPKLSQVFCHNQKLMQSSNAMSFSLSKPATSCSMTHLTVQNELGLLAHNYNLEGQGRSVNSSPTWTKENNFKKGWGQLS